MYIQKVLSNLNAWHELYEGNSDLLQEIRNALTNIEPASMNPAQFSRAIESRLAMYGWTSQHLLAEAHFSRTLIKTVDLFKDPLGIEIFSGNAARLERLFFVKFPMAIHAKQVKIAVLIIPVQSLARDLGTNLGSFERIKETLTEFDTIGLKYPFVVMGIGVEDQEMTSVIELNTALDSYLIGRLGCTLKEIRLGGESDNIEFKEMMPSNDKLARQACAFANTTGGGIMIFGITDDGAVTGIPGNEWDEYQTKVANVFTSACLPNPEFRMLRFDTDDPTRQLFVIDIQELATKPCVTNDGRIYIRQGGTSRPAKSEDIRRMILR